MAHASSTVDTSASTAAAPLESNGYPKPQGCLAEDPFVTLYHELRSPLGLIATTALGAASECAEGSATRRQLERISRVAERTLRVTETVLALARKDTERPSGTAFLPGEVLTSLVVDSAEQGGQQMLLDVRPEARAVQLLGRAGHFEGMVQALLTNACDHGAAESPIRVQLEVAGDTLCLTVDNRVAQQRSHRGLGIGSYLARRLAGELGGTLTAAHVGDEYRVRFTTMIPPRPAAASDDCLSGNDGGRRSDYLA